MPFKSKAQQRKFFAMESRGEIEKGTAREWAHATPSIKNLPEHVKSSGYSSPMDTTALLRLAYNQGVKVALEEDLPEYQAAKAAGIAIETPGVPVERPLHHDVVKSQPARFGAKGREYEQKHAEDQPDYVTKARAYADKYHTKLLAHLKSEYDKANAPPTPKEAGIGFLPHVLMNKDKYPIMHKTGLPSKAELAALKPHLSQEDYEDFKKHVT